LIHAVEAMAAYSTAQMEENLSEEVFVSQSAPKPWRRFGLVAAALGTVGAVVGMTRPQVLTPVQQMQQMAHMSHSFLQAFVARALQEEKALSVDMGLTLAEEGREPNAMTIDAYLRPGQEDETAKGKQELVFAFKAKSDLGDSLKGEFDKMKDEGKKLLKDHAQMLEDMVKVSSEGDIVTIRIDVPPMGNDMQEEAAKGMGAVKPSFKFSIGTGRGFDEMVDKIAEGVCPVTLPGGVKLSVSTQLATALFETMEKAASKAKMHGHAEQIGKMKAMLGSVEGPMEGISSLSSQTTVGYNKEAMEKSEMCCHFPGKEEMSGPMQQVRGGLQKLVPPPIAKIVEGLAQYSKSLHYIRFTGLPDGYELHVDFVNFKLTPVLKKLLEEREAGGD